MVWIFFQFFFSKKLFVQTAQPRFIARATSRYSNTMHAVQHLLWALYIRRQIEVYWGYTTISFYNRNCYKNSYIHLKQLTILRKRSFLDDWLSSASSSCRWLGVWYFGSILKTVYQFWEHPKWHVIFLSLEFKSSIELSFYHQSSSKIWLKCRKSLISTKLALVMFKETWQSLVKMHKNTSNRNFVSYCRPK